MSPKHEPVLLWPTSNVTHTAEADPDTRDPGSINSDPRGLPPGPVFSLNEDVITNDGVSEPSMDIQLNGSATISPSCELGACAVPFFSPFSPTTCHLAPDRAPELLRYFKNNIILLSFPLMGGRKCPWQTVHLPSAEKTYAELLLHQAASHTGLSLFYSLLAASCLHLSSRGKSSVDWDKFGKSYKQIARHQLECAVQQEIVGLERIKYKEFLMALLSMVMLEVLTHHPIYI
jgi:arginine metabolism regulation protein II